MKNLLYIILIFGSNGLYAQNTGTVKGVVWDDEYHDYAYFVNAILENRIHYFKTVTDIDGNYQFSDVPPGTYTLTFDNWGITTKVTTPIVVETDKVTLVPQQTINRELELTVCYYTPRMRPNENPEMNRTELLESVNKFQLQELTLGMSSRLTETSSGELSVRGGTGNQLQFIDGVKSREIHALPSSSIRKITIYEGFIPANYGDATGAIVVTGTLGYFDLMILRW